MPYANREKYLSHQKSCYVAKKTERRCLHLKKAYGITCDEYQDMFSRQNGRCALCFSLPGKKSLAVDHDHTTGKIRDLLCSNCNTGIGNLRDSIPLIAAALAYLEKWKEE